MDYTFRALNTQNTNMPCSMKRVEALAEKTPKREKFSQPAARAGPEPRIGISLVGLELGSSRVLDGTATTRLILIKHHPRADRFLRCRMVTGQASECGSW